MAWSCDKACDDLDAFWCVRGNGTISPCKCVCHISRGRLKKAIEVPKTKKLTHPKLSEGPSTEKDGTG